MGGKGGALSSLPGGAGGTEVIDPGQPLPAVVYDADAPDTEVGEAIKAWCAQHSRGDVADVLAAVLAARHANATDISAYAGKCLADGVREHWRQRAEVLLNPSRRRSSARVHGQGNYGTPQPFHLPGSHSIARVYEPDADYGTKKVI